MSRLFRHVVLAAFAVAVSTAFLHAQGVTVSQVGDAVTVRAPGFTFIKGEPLARLKDGRSVRVDLALAILPRSGAAAVTHREHAFVLSYDLWEERFAVTRVGVPPRSAAYLTTAAAETWCIDHLSVPLTALGSLGRTLPFWIRLEYRILDSDPARPADNGSGYTLQSLIDVFGRRRKAQEWTHAIEAGPFHLRP